MANIKQPKQDSFQQVGLPELPELELNIVPTPGGSTLKDGELKSPNFVHLKKGWRVDSEGKAEFQSITLNGVALTNKGTFGGDGSDGALSITSGTTTINLGSALVVVK